MKLLPKDLQVLDISVDLVSKKANDEKMIHIANPN